MRQFSVSRRTFLAESAGIIVTSSMAVANQPGRSGEDPSLRLKAMTAMARGITVRELAEPASESGKPVALRAEPLLRYSDEPRAIHDATLWAWGATGRPAAVLKVEHLPARPPERRWVEGIVTLSSGLLSVDLGAGQSWKSRKPGLLPKAVPDAPAPAATEGARLAQMRSLTRRFAASEYAGPARGRLQLRLLTSPLHRYKDETAGLVDGALFAFAYGTNPDVLLVLEANRVPASSATPIWSYAAARLGGGEASMTLDGKDVWTEPYADPPSERDTYLNRWVAEKD
ncbi:MAG: hypothetical protein JWN86_1606 [Planctomycetota bacterium]|nr:hypothetical protein [Planctomycetota bacterium]